uniref:Uncharacterized protein n=1 Tax=Timema monikensis TaxID=170555 RepID=A0A7R9DZU3_9NEOP|nr:unnamed protein product [Timema monikensis]
MVVGLALSMAAVSSERSLTLGSELAVIRGVLMWPDVLCRNTQFVFDACVLNNLNLERPPFDYYNQVRVHVTPRPKPPPLKPDVFPDPTPKLPDDYPREPAKYGSRFHWLN